MASRRKNDLEDTDPRLREMRDALMGRNESLHNGDDRYGTAHADRIREQRETLEQNTRSAIERFKDIPTDDSFDRVTSPNITVNLNQQHRPSIFDSLRPKRKKQAVESDPPQNHVKRNLAISGLITAILTGILTALKSKGIIP